MAGELPEDIKATLSILDSQTPPPPAELKTTRTMEDIALPTKRQPAGGDDVLQTIAILDGKEPEPVATAGEPDPRDIEVDVLKLALRKGINSNTALAAHRQSVARKLNISPALVTPQAEESAFYQDHDPEDLHKNYPALAKYLKVEGNAELVGKNIEPMKEMEVFFRRAVQDPEIVAAKGVVGAVQTLVGLGNLVSAGKAGKYVEEHGIDLKKIQSVLNDLYTPEAQAALKSVEEAEGFSGTLTAALKNPSSIGLFVGESLPQMYLGRVFGSGLKAAFPGLSFGTAGAAGEGITMAGGSAEQIRSATEDGELTAGQAALSVGVGVAGAAIGAVGAKLAKRLGIEDPDAAFVAGKLLSRLEDSGVPKQLAVRLVGGAAIEGAVEEMPQSVVEQIAQNVALGRAWDEGVPESAALGLVTGGAMGAAVQVGAVRGKRPIVTETPAEKQARTTVQNSILKTTAAVNAEEQRNAIKEWGQRVASNNPLRKEAPDSFKEFVRTMAEEDGALKEVYVDGKLLRESLAQAGIDGDKLKSTMPEVAESLDEALATNGEARIPIEDYAAHIVGTPVEQAILDHLRTTPEGMTYAEAQVYFQEQQDDFIKQAEALVSINEPVLSRKEFEAQAPEGVKYRDYLAAHKNKVEVFAKDLETVHDRLLEGLDSTGRFPKSITRVYAIPFREFYAANAARMGVLPSELYKSLPLNFEQMSAGDVLDQRAFHGSPHSFDRFSSEKIGAGEGAQAYGYGLYFTDTKAVAEHYRQAYKNNKLVLPSGADLNEAAVGTEERFAQTLLKANSGDYAKSLTENKVEENASAGDKRFSKEVEKMLKDYKKRGVKAVSLSGGIYEVELAPEQDEYLLWDRPLSEQSEKVKAALEKYYKTESSVEYLNAVKEYDNGNTRAIKDAGFNVLDYPGAAGGMYEREAGFDGARKVSRAFHRYGIRGIKYLDQSSRPGGEGTYNYVVFDDRDVAITQVYAQSAKMPSQSEIERRLVAQHNISVANLIHADRMGGLAAPSLAITDKAHTFDSFGDITLISDRSMVDPRSGAKVFGADIYSPRYPRVEYTFSKDRVNRLNEELKKQFALTNEKPVEVYEINGDASDAASTLENNAAVMAAFLESKKIKPRIVKVKKKAIPRWALKYADKTMYTYIDTPAFIEDVAKHTEHIDEILARAENEEERSLMRKHLANSKAYEIDAYRVDSPNFGKADPKASLSEMNRQVYDKGLHKEYTSYVYNLTTSMNPTERIFKGFTNSGNRKYIPHTIDNVIAELRKNLRGGENFNYGLGSIRARYTPQFKTVEQIRKAGDRLLSSEDFERVKTELDTEFNAVLEELTRYYKHRESAGFGLYEVGSQALTDAASMGVARALKENQFENVPQETQNRVADFLAKLSEVPAEYFEVKLLRRVGLQEFSGAVVPKNAGQNVIDILKKNGVTDIKFYKPQDKADRLAKVNEFNSLFFQSAFYSALQREIPSISKIADKNGMVKTDQAVAWIEARQKEGKFKLEEVEAVGLKDWLRATEGKVSVADIDTFVRENGVQIEEKLLGGVALPVAVQEYEDQPEIYSLYRADDPEGISYGSLGQIILTGKGEYEINVPEITGKIHYPTLQEALERVSRGAKVFSETKFEQYKLPGGENYREFLLTLPKTEGQGFKSAHYDEKNILAHVRFDDRVDPSTKERILFIEEVQSDWAQEGRKKGFAKPRWTPAEERRVRELEKPRPYPGLTQSERDEYNTLMLKREEGGTPTAPFVQNTKSWVALAVKRVLRYAAENGYSKIAWTNGSQQAARYDLSKQISEIRYSNGYLKAYDLDNKLVLNNSSVTEEELPDIIGKEAAQKLLEQPKEGEGKTQVLSGLDLKVGGEGMVAFYDKLLPQVVNDVAKKLGGGKVGSVALSAQAENPTAEGFIEWSSTNQPGMPENVLRRMWARGDADETVRKFKGEVGLSEQQSLEITPEMREKILSGLPLFQGQRAGFDPSTFTISLLKGADLSSVIHEGAHFYLEALADLAGRDNAPQQIKDDFRTTLEWFGITGDEEGVPGGSMLAQGANIPETINIDGETTPPGQLPPGKTPEEIWRSMTLDQKRRYHEQWAQSYERYTMEGKAPTVEMQSVFSRFREWMLSVYKSMKDFLAQNPLAGKLNDDIRAVFDRLIASEDKIYQAEEARGYSALFGSAAEAGLSEKEFEDYQNLGKLASMRAVDEMKGRSIRDMRWLSNAKDKTIKRLQAEAKNKRAAVMAQVTDEVDSMPLNRARNFLTKGEFLDEQGVRRESETKFKLNSAEVKALSNGQVPDAVKGMVSDDGVGLELAAKLLGYQNPEALLNDLVNGESRDVTIQGLTDQRMLEQYGDLIDDKAIERAAEKAIHNEARAKFMATGLKILAKTELSATQLNRAAKLAAEATIAKKKIRALTPGQFTRAEAKANREAIESVAKDPQKAVEAQRAALLNNRLAKAALEASEEVDSILKYFKKFESQGVRKAVGIDQIDQIDDLLQTVDRDKNLPLREIDKRQALAEWVAEQEADGFEPVLDPILAEQIKAKHYKEMTVDELRMLRDTVKQIEHVGRLKQTLLTEMRRADFRERVEEAEASIRDNANRTVKERGTPTDVAGITGQWVRQMIASHRKFSSYMREMDGGKDGGVMWRLLSKNMNAAGDQEIEMRRASGEAIAELFKGFKQEKAPLNLYAKRTQIPGTEIFMTQEQRIMFGMNWGNEGNRQRLLDGGITDKRALSITEAQAILDTLTKEEWDFIQGTWDHIATYKDQIAALERKLTGIEPEWIEPSEIKTKYGTYRGGYFPAKYDVELSSRSESLEAAVDLRMGMKGAFNTAATRNGYTKQRSEAVMNRPLLLSYNVIANHISEVTHRLAWQPWLIDANRILRALDAPIREHYGAEVLRELRNTVIDIAAGDIGARTPMERAINHLRTGSTIVGMGWRFSTAFLQPSGLAQSWARIGGRWMAKGIAESLKNPNKAGEFVNARSSLMNNRDITMNREVREVLDRIRTTEGVNAVTGSYFSLIAKMQRMVDIPTWMGAYEKALHDLKYEAAMDAEQRVRIENDAVALADQAVVDSQSGGQIKDLASIQRGHPGLKLFTNFYSYFSATYNLNIEALRRTNFRSPTDVAFLASDLVLLNVLPVIFAVALKEMTKGKCGDDIECLAASYGYEQMGFMFGQMVLLRDAGSAALVAAGGDQFGYSGPAGLRFFSDLYKAGVQANQGELDWPLFKSVSNTAGVLLHFPTGQINTTLEGIIAVENGDVDGVSILPALLFGPPKE